MQGASRSESDGWYLRFVVALVNGVTARPGLTLSMIALSAALSAWYAYENVRMNSDNAQLVRQDAEFRQAYHDYLDAFPQYRDTTLVVLTGSSLDLVSDAQERLAAALAERTDLVSTVYAPGSDPFFEDHAFLFLDPPELENVIERLARAQPALVALTVDPSLRGLFGELELGVDDVNSGGEPPLGLVRMSDRISEIGEGLLAGRPAPLRWTDEFFAEDDTVYRLVILQGQVDYGETVPTEKLVKGIRSTAQTLGITPENGVTLRLTGMIPLAYEELATMRSGLAIAGTISSVLLIIILGFGLRSLRIFVATVASLIASLCWTPAYAMATVGEFNTISAAFGVLLLGLGVDFGIHIGLRYEEETRRGIETREALARAIDGTGLAISLCALTSAIGFASFIPTEYRGLAALGTIASGGMFFALVSSFTVFPAVLALVRPPSHYERMEISGSRLQAAVIKHAGLIAASAALIALIAGALAVRQLTFDFSTLAMKDPDAEGMVAYNELQAEGIVTDYSLTVLAPDRASAEALAVELAKLPGVAEARAPSYFEPSEQAYKLEMLSDASFFLEGVLAPGPVEGAPDDAARLASIRSLRDAIRELPANDTDPELLAAARRLEAVLDGLLASPDPAGRARELEALVTDGLAERMDWLRRALGVEAIAFEDLPASRRDRLVDRAGRHSVLVLPSGDMSVVEELQAFVDGVKRIAPDATGRPAVEVGIGGIVVRSFRLAIGLSFVAIMIILVASLRSLVDAFLVLVPIILAALITIAFGISFDVPFTMANVVAVPLVLGLGVDGGIHVFMRYRHDGALDHTLSSSTPRAVLLSSLTTLAAFGALSVSPHRGFSGLGILLSIAVIALLYCTLIVLPALVALRERWSTAPRPTP